MIEQTTLPKDKTFLSFTSNFACNRGPTGGVATYMHEMLAGQITSDSISECIFSSRRSTDLHWSCCRQINLKYIHIRRRDGHLWGLSVSQSEH